MLGKPNAFLYISPLWGMYERLSELPVNQRLYFEPHNPTGRFMIKHKEIEGHFPATPLSD